jgi:hypothetical protein
MKTIVKIDKNLSIFRLKCELPENVTGIGYSQSENSVVFYCSYNGSVGFVNDAGKIKFASRRLEVNSPAGLCCDQWGICILQFSENMIWNFNQSYSSGMRLCGSGTFNSISKNLPGNVNNFAPYGICRTNMNSVIMAAPWGNKLIVLEDGKPRAYIGSGKLGFLSSMNLKASMFSSPSGVCFDPGSGMICVSDTGNSIIRIFKNGHEISFVGVPGKKSSEDGIGTLARLLSPSAIRASKGVVAFVDDNLVRTFKISSLDVTTLYASSNKVVDLAIGGGATYILEENK